jgi:predicted Zn-dependent protease
LNIGYLCFKETNNTFFMNKLHKLLLSILFILVADLFSGCYKVPVSGRSQFNLLPESMLVNLAKTNYNQIISQGPVVRQGGSNNLANAVYKVGQKMTPAVDTYLRKNGHAKRLKDIKWELNVIEKNMVNAWCMPGGKIAFYTGILPICRDEAGIAAVMGHEMAHAIARHGNERMSQQLAIVTGLTSLNVAIQQRPTETNKLLLAAAGLGAEVGISLPFSRKHETEADQLGLIFMALAGYNPNQAIDFWQRMSQVGGGSRPPEFLSTHPAPSTRIENLRKFMPKATKYYRP